MTRILTEPSTVSETAVTEAESTTGRAARRAPVSDGTTPGRVAEGLDPLTERIGRGEYDGNGILASEGELAASFSVSRTVIREARRGLRAAGLVEVSQGRAPRVKPPDSQVSVTSLRLLLRRNKATRLHLAEVRRPLPAQRSVRSGARKANFYHFRAISAPRGALEETRPSPSLRVSIAGYV